MSAAGETRCDLLVVGAGPAGCAAAVAARAAAPGLSVLVVDAARFPREKPCGGALTGGALRELERAGLELRVPHVVVRHATLRSAGRVTRVELAAPAAVVRRIELDADLVGQARRAGAIVEEASPLLALDGDRARTAAGPVRFRAMIAADGVAGAARRALGFPAGVRVPLREARSPSTGQWDLHFDLDAVPGGYAWRFPCVDGGRPAESCGAYAAGPSAGLGAALDRFTRREGLLPGPVSPSAIRAYRPGGPVGRDGALLAGEALGVDPLAGEGLRYALWSGRIAGRLAAAALRRGAVPRASAYRAALLGSRSGVVLELTARLAHRLHGPDSRWRAIAAERPVAEAFARLVSGDLPVGPLLGLASRYARLAAAAQPP